MSSQRPYRLTLPLNPIEPTKSIPHVVKEVVHHVPLSDGLANDLRRLDHVASKVYLLALPAQDIGEVSGANLVPHLW